MPMTAETDTPETGESAAPATAPAAAAKRRPRARTARPKLDAVSAAAVDLAREALIEVTEPDQVGEHLRVEASGERLVTHVFACAMPGYSGWVWNVVLARAPRAKQATVCETVLLPGDSALLAPDWEPWAERLKPSDVGADDLLPYQEADERLEQGYEQTDDADADRVAQWELGLGRPRVLSPVGREEAADRWFAGDFGPRPVSARKRRGTVTATCSSCGFLTLMAGSLRTEFGVCTNEWSVADGHVVHLDYGCGSHSETGKEESHQDSDPEEGVVVDEYRVDVDRSTSSDEDAAVVEEATETEGAAKTEGAAEATDSAAPEESGEAEAAGETVAAGATEEPGEAEAAGDAADAADAADADSEETAEDSPSAAL
ncbi:DUF3027 domain-containing protein [Brachybacterium sp. ACRRE]|uniref:DUF3027 domain-containing protein n=1 Tax=Brachybacterium sp. ACRRE TaxID=2918184 RepID=UPI001EF1843C|nr:DUF3027 domain-containing protein [Brachybacterium sp. ACRRE]MCG7310644.1 DUF3027 domain-containing protein [Brachybacterium sp. ACRRE]